MIPVPNAVMNDYVALLKRREIAPDHFEYLKKWLRYFYDFSAKYLDTADKPEMVKQFLGDKGDALRIFTCAIHCTKGTIFLIKYEYLKGVPCSPKAQTCRQDQYSGNSTQKSCR